MEDTKKTGQEPEEEKMVNLCEDMRTHEHNQDEYERLKRAEDNTGK